MKYDVFISHSSGDLEIAERICDYLQDNGISCWIDSRNITGGYARSIIEGIKESELLVLVFSNKVNESMHVENEIDNAFCMKKAIIPFRIEDVAYSDVLRYYLSKAHYVDASKDMDKALEELRIQIKRQLPEQQKAVQVENALKFLADQYNVDIETIKELFDEYQKRKQGTDAFEGFLSEFINGNSTPNVDDTGNDNPSDEATSKDTSNNSGDGRYDILQNGAGEILIIKNWEKSEPENPRFVTDGGSTAILYKNKESSTVLENIVPKAVEAIMQVDELLIVEVLDDDVAREYKVPVRKIASLNPFLKI